MVIPCTILTRVNNITKALALFKIRCTDKGALNEPYPNKQAFDDFISDPESIVLENMCISKLKFTNEKSDNSYLIMHKQM